MRLAIAAVLGPSCAVDELTCTEQACAEKGMRLLLAGLVPVFESTTSGVVLRGRGNAATSLLMDMANSDLRHRQMNALQLLSDIFFHLVMAEKRKVKHVSSSALDESLNTRGMKTLYGIFKIVAKKINTPDISAGTWETILFCFTQLSVLI
jgi:hypothetical protein